MIFYLTYSITFGKCLSNAFYLAFLADLPFSLQRPGMPDQIESEVFGDRSRTEKNILLSERVGEWGFSVDLKN
jgi:hypothetical protein